MVKCRSIEKILRQKLFEVVIATIKPQIASFSADNIPFSRLNYPIGRVYRSALAFQLAKVCHRPSSEIAEELAICFTQVGLTVDEKQDLEFSAIVIEPGWLDFPLSDRALAIWLQQLPQLLHRDHPDEEFTQIPAPSDNHLNVFPLQFAHARCCSLLRLGHREGLITLNNPELSQPGWYWQDPDPIPWMTNDNHLSQFQLVHPTETYLIGQILAFTDALDRTQPENWRDRGMDLAEAVLEFNRHCQILGAVKQKIAQLAQARLGLIAIVQLLLQGLLQEQIRVSALTKI